MSSYDDWRLQDDGDDLGSMETGEPTWYTVCCVSCAGLFDVRADDRPPYRCAKCCARDAEDDQRAADRRDA